MKTALPFILAAVLGNGVLASDQHTALKSQSDQLQRVQTGLQTVIDTRVEHSLNTRLALALQEDASLLELRIASQGAAAANAEYVRLPVSSDSAIRRASDVVAAVATR